MDCNLSLAGYDEGATWDRFTKIALQTFQAFGIPVFPCTGVMKELKDDQHMSGKMHFRASMKVEQAFASNQRRPNASRFASWSLQGVDPWKDQTMGTTNGTTGPKTTGSESRGQDTGATSDQVCIANARNDFVVLLA